MIEFVHYSKANFNNCQHVIRYTCTILSDTIIKKNIKKMKEYVGISKPKKYRNKIEVVATKIKLITHITTLHKYS